MIIGFPDLETNLGLWLARSDLIQKPREDDALHNKSREMRDMEIPC
jgi:hypothetical protein